MAVAVPLIMGAMGAGTMATVITTVAFAVTGISAKINQAAAKVFGEDLVQIGNMAGAAFMAFSGAFPGGAANAAEVGAGAANGAFLGEGVASGVGAWDGAMNLSNMAAGGAESLSSMAMPGLEEGAQGLMNEADAIGQMGGDVGDFTSAVNGQQSANVLDAIGTQPSPMDVANATGQPQSILPTTGPTSTQAAGSSAAGSNAAGSSASGANAAGTGAASANAAAPVTGQPPAAPRGFFDRLIFDDKGGINPSTLRIGGQVLAGYGSSQAQRELYDRKMAEERRRASQGVGFRVTN